MAVEEHEGIRRIPIASRAKRVTLDACELPEWLDSLSPVDLLAIAVSSLSAAVTCRIYHPSRCAARENQQLAFLIPLGFWAGTFIALQLLLDGPLFKIEPDGDHV